jgi:hypothetical protein
MTFSHQSAALQRARRRRRAFAAIACVFLGGASLGAAVSLAYPRSSHRPYEKAFDSIGLTAAQRHATDSIFARYGCVIDSVNHAIAPQIDSIRHRARQEIFELLSESQITRLNAAMNADDGWHGQHHPDKHGMCDHGADSASFDGRSRRLRL